MKLLLISDVHSNIFALEAIERQEKHADAILCAGDLVDYGTHPCEVIDWVRDHRATVVLGNHDVHLLSMTEEACEAAGRERRYKWVHDNYRKLDGARLDYLRRLPVCACFEADGIRYQVQHQFGPAYEMPESIAQFNAFWKGEARGERRLVFGHTHRRCVHALGESMTWMNPGSVSYRRPDDPDKRAHYLVIEEGRWRFGAVDYPRGGMLEEAVRYLRAGTMLETELQDAFFFFGDAPTSREPLPSQL